MENLPPTRVEKRFFRHKNCTSYVKQTDEGGEFSNSGNNAFCWIIRGDSGQSSSEISEGNFPSSIYH